MSVHPLECPTCHVECRPDGVGRFGEAPNYGVAWLCPKCGHRSLDICPLGPLVPLATTCLNCGGTFPDEDSPCPECGLPREQVLPSLGLTEEPAVDPVAEARDRFQKGLYRSGLAVLNQALVHDFRLVEVWRLKCQFYNELGFTGQTIAMLKEALERGAPTSLWFNYAFALQQADQHAEAVAAYRRFLALHPADPWAGVVHANLANSLRRIGKPDEAEEHYRQALAVEPGRVTHYWNLAQLLFDLRRVEEAVGVLESALRHLPPPEYRARILEDLAFGYAELERAEDALQAADEALRLRPGGASGHYLRGRALALLGRLAEAREEMVRVLQIEPNHADGKRALTMIDQVLGTA